MAKNAFEFDAKDIISDDPADWIAFAEKSLKKLRYTYNASYWAAQLIRRFAIFANEIYLNDDFEQAFFSLIYAPIHETAKTVRRKDDFCCDLEIQNPLFSLALLFLDEVNDGKANVPQAIINNLVLVIDVAYRLIGVKSGNVNEGKRLSAAFSDFANTCLTVRNTKYTKAQLLDAERIFLQHNRYFFDRALRPQPTEIFKPDGKSSLYSLLGLLKYVQIEDDQKAELREAERKAVRRLSSDEEDDELAATEETEADASPSPSDADLIAKASESIASAIEKVKDSEPFYNQETKIRPTEFISEQLDPERGPIVPRMRFLQNIQRPKSIAVEPFLESLQSFNKKMTAYFIAVFGCATTRNLTRLTFSAEQKWEVFNFYASHFGVSSDADDKSSLHDKAVAKFGDFGNAMKKLGVAFAEYEHELPNKPILLIGAAASKPKPKKRPPSAKMPHGQLNDHKRHCQMIETELEAWRKHLAKQLDGGKNPVRPPSMRELTRDVNKSYPPKKGEKPLEISRIRRVLESAIGLKVDDAKWVANPTCHKRPRNQDDARHRQMRANFQDYGRPAICIYWAAFSLGSIPFVLAKTEEIERYIQRVALEMNYPKAVRLVPQKFV